MNNNEIQASRATIVPQPIVNEVYFTPTVALERRKEFLRMKINALQNHMIETAAEISRTKAELEMLS